MAFSGWVGLQGPGGEQRLFSLLTQPSKSVLLATTHCPELLLSWLPDLCKDSPSPSLSETHQWDDTWPRGALRSPPSVMAGVCSEWLVLGCHLLMWAFKQYLVAIPQWLFATSSAVR